MQELIVILIVSAAAVFVAMRIRGAAKGESDCGTCSSSPGCAIAAIAAARKKRHPLLKLWDRLRRPFRGRKRPPADMGNGFQV